MHIEVTMLGQLNPLSTRVWALTFPRAPWGRGRRVNELQGSRHAQMEQGMLAPSCMVRGDGP